MNYTVKEKKSTFTITSITLNCETEQQQQGKSQYVFPLKRIGREVGDRAKGGQRMAN